MFIANACVLGIGIVSGLTTLGVAGLILPAVLLAAMIVDVGVAYSLATDEARHFGKIHGATGRIEARQREHLALSKQVHEKHKDALALLTNLLDNGVIDDDETYQHMSSRDVFTVNCSPTGYPERLPDIPLRKYPQYLESLGFVRMGRRSTHFVISSDRLSPELRNVVALRQFLTNKVTGVLRREWKEYMHAFKRAAAGDKKLTKLYRKCLQRRTSDRLAMSVLVLRAPLNGKSIGVINYNVHNRQFRELLAEMLDVQQLRLSAPTKAKVKHYLTDASIGLVFQHLPLGERRRLLAGESAIKRTLNISSLFDYLERADADISSAFARHVPAQHARRYANDLKKGVAMYRDAMRQLGVGLA